MNTNEPREPASTEGAQLGEDERLDVLVEDLFIEEYPPAGMTERMESPIERSLTPARRKLRGRGRGIVAGIVVLGAIGFVALLFARPKIARRIARGVSRMMPRAVPRMLRFA